MIYSLNIDGTAEERVIFSGIMLNVAELCRFGSTPEQIVSGIVRSCGIAGLKQISGPFTAALTDGAGTVTLVRDSLGQRQLYYRISGSAVLFSEKVSELLTPGMSTDMQAVSDYLSLGYIPAPYTIKKEIRSLAAGHYIQFKGGKATPQLPYFTPQFFPKATLSYREACHQLDELLTRAMQRCLKAYPHPAVLLSGGIDSNLMLHYAAKQMTEMPTAFTLYVDDTAYSEVELASASAKACGAEHCKYKATAEDVRRIADILCASGQPFGDSSLLASTLIMSKAASHCNAVIMGDGGDELFGGYKRYQFMAIRDALGRPLTALGKPFAALLAKLLPKGRERRAIFSTVRRMTEAFTMEQLPCYASFQEIFSRNEALELCPGLKETEFYQKSWLELLEESRLLDQSEAANYIDICTYLPEDGCRKDNTAAQLCGIAALSPMLDMEVAQFAFSLPRSYKTTIFSKKKPLRTLAEGRIPAALLHQPKRGFSLPIGNWFRHELKETLLSLPERVPDYIEKRVVSRLVEEHLACRGDFGSRLWLLMTLANNA